MRSCVAGRGAAPLGAAGARSSAAGTPPIHSTSFDYGARAHRGRRSSPPTGSTPSTPPAGPCSTRSSSTRPREAGADGALRHHRGRHPRRPPGGSVGIRGRDHGRQPTEHRAALGGRRGRHPLDRRRRGGRPLRTARHRGASAFIYGYWSDLERRRLRVGVPARCLRRPDPHQRRTGVRVHRLDPGPDRPGWSDACSTRSWPRPRLTWRRGWPSATHRAACGPSRGRPGYLRRSHGPGWALVGDAGYWKDPISAHGLTDALRDAELLAWALDAPATATGAGAGAREYQATRDELSAELFTVTDVIAGRPGPPTRSRACSYRLSSAMADEMDAIDRLDQRPVPTAGGPG